MAVLVGEATRVLVQGLTGRAGTFYTDLAVRYGSNYVAGVRPGKGGSAHVGLPVFDKVAEAVAATGADASLVLVPPHQAAAAMIEAIEAGLALVVCVTERVPVHDMLRVRAALKGSATELVGPNSQGVLAPGVCKIGVMSTANAKPGPIGIVSRSASLTSEIVAQTTAAGLGQSTTVGIGGDPIHGTGFRRCLELFRDDPATEGVILIGEIGGAEEEEAADYLAGGGFGKPVVALIVGRHAPKERRMGHAGTLAVFGAGSVEGKAKRLAAAGAVIARDADAVAGAMRSALARSAAAAG
jgi:succinyl-CoA synthetase alpha subunit